MAARADDDAPMNGMMRAIAVELRAWREAAGLTQEQLADLMGFSTSVIGKLETCRTRPSKQHAEKLDQVLRTPGPSTFVRLREWGTHLDRDQGSRTASGAERAGAGVGAGWGRVRVRRHRISATTTTTASARP